MGSLFTGMDPSALCTGSPVTPSETCSTWTSLSRELPLPDIFKLVYCVALTVGKRAIDIRLKCLLVCLVICLWRANHKLSRNFVAWEKALKATDNTRNDLSIFLFIKQLLVPKQTCGSLYKGKTPAVYHSVSTNLCFNFIHLILHNVNVSKYTTLECKFKYFVQNYADNFEIFDLTSNMHWGRLGVLLLLQKSFLLCHEIPRRYSMTNLQAIAGFD